MDVVLGIDLGTTEVKAGLFALDGRPVALARRSYPMLPGPPGAAEQDPATWWRAIVASVRELAPAAHTVRAVCGVAQGPTLVVVDAHGAHLRPAITWLDRRANAVGARGGRSGFGLGPKVAWLTENEPDVLGQGRWLLTAWDWLTLRLTATAVTSRQPGEASSEDEPSALGPVGQAAFAPAVPVGSVVGRLVPAAAGELGVPPGVPVVAGVNDGTATILGSGLRVPGDAVDTGGASGGLAIYADHPVHLPGIFSAPAPLARRWVLGGAMAASGASFDWLRRVVGAHDGPEALIEEAAAAAPGARGLVFLPYLAGERSPIWDAAARGAFLGLSVEHARGHLVRAVLEASAFALRHVAEPIRRQGVPVTELRLAGRSGASRTWAQIKADVMEVPAAMLSVPEASLVGAAVLAATGSGVLPDLERAVEQMVHVVERIEPRAETRATYDTIFEVYRSLYPLLVPAMHELAALQED